MTSSFLGYLFVGAVAIVLWLPFFLVAVYLDELRKKYSSKSKVDNYVQAYVPVAKVEVNGGLHYQIYRSGYRYSPKLSIIPTSGVAAKQLARGIFDPDYDGSLLDPGPFRFAHLEEQ